MKTIVIMSLLMLSQISVAAESYTYVTTQNPQTAQSIFALPASARDCDEDRNEEWQCETNVKNRSGTIDISRCGGGKGSWACYEDIEESCKERNSGRTSSRSYRQFTGTCTDNLSECW